MSNTYEKTKNNPRVRAARILNNAKQRAKRKNLTYNLTPEWFEEQLALGACAVSGLPFDVSVGTDEARSNPWAPSLDRIDPAKGYTPENTQVVCWAYNAMKNQWSHTEMMKLARALVDNE